MSKFKQIVDPGEESREGYRQGCSAKPWCMRALVVVVGMWYLLIATIISHRYAGPTLAPVRNNSEVQKQSIRRLVENITFANATMHPTDYFTRPDDNRTYVLVNIHRQVTPLAVRHCSADRALNTSNYLLPASAIPGVKANSTTPACQGCPPQFRPGTLLRLFDYSQDIKIALSSNRSSVGIAMAITSKKLFTKHKTNKTTVDFILRNHFPIFKAFLPSFCHTATPGYDYRLYLAYDYNDDFFTNSSHMVLFSGLFQESVRKHCIVAVELVMVKCTYSGAPAWAQNAAAMEAYMDGNDFIHRINDDIEMKTPNWTKQYIGTLRKRKPPLVGVTGPVTKNGNRKIMIFDFVHKTHVDIFGFYYPKDFPDWFSDGWISTVYQPGYSEKTKGVLVAHLASFGMRYAPHRKLKNDKPTVLTREKHILNLYLKMLKTPVAAGNRTARPKRLICMFLNKPDPVTTSIILRNAQLFPVFLPSWEVHLFIADHTLTEYTSQTALTRVLAKLFETKIKLHSYRSASNVYADDRLQVVRQIVINGATMNKVVMWPSGKLISEPVAKRLDIMK